MFELKRFVPKSGRQLRATPGYRRPPDPQQRRMMFVALALLVAALGFELYADRDFWFPYSPEAQETNDQPRLPATAEVLPDATPSAAPPQESPARGNSRRSPSPASAPADPASVDRAPSDASLPPITISARTVLPPLEVEVVAGDVHRTLHPGSNSVQLDLQPNDLRPNDPQPETSSAGPAADPTDTAASAATNAAERVQMSADTAQVLTEPVKPGYPLLARQMKVQGSVILQALIGRDGVIQDLRILSGPPILATAAQEAVRQWHFKPHFQGDDPVETQAKIKVNFTISTN